MSDIAAAINWKFPGLYRIEVPVSGQPSIVPMASGATIPTQAEIDQAIFDYAVASKKRAIDAERDRLIYRPIGPVDVRGDGTLMVEPDIRNQQDRINLTDLHTRAMSLQVEGVTAAVITFGAADNQEYDLTPAEVLTLTEAPFDRASGLYVTARQKKTAMEQLTTLAEVEAYDETTGW